VDDGSIDATPRIVASLAATEPRLELRSALPLPEGWSGKVNALATGFEHVSSEWVLLTDADTRHAPDLLSRAHAAVAEHRLDALSLAGTQEALGFGENLLTPPVYALLDWQLGDWAPHARGEGPSAIANGQYFLVRVAALRALGGFGAIAGQLLDDVALARALRSGGFRVGFRRAGDALRIRMYRGMRDTFGGWRRNLALLFGERPRVLLSILALAGLTSIALAALLLDGSSGPLALGWTGGVAASALARRSSGNDPLFGLFFPLDLFALAWVLALGAGDRRRGRLTPWRGRDLSA
jgi:glycosyltransferase involved in cell wall biosynthesis